MTGAGDLRERVAFDSLTITPDGYGGEDRTWGEVGQRAAEFTYERGREAQAPGGATGTATFRVRVRSDSLTRALTAEGRMRDVRREVAYNIRDVDAVTDRAWVFLRVESGVAV